MSIQDEMNRCNLKLMQLSVETKESEKRAAVLEEEASAIRLETVKTRHREAEVSLKAAEMYLKTVTRNDINAEMTRNPFSS